MDTIETLLEEFGSAALTFDRVAVDTLAAKLSSFIGTNLAQYPPAFIGALSQSVSSFDTERTRRLCSELIIHVRSGKSAWSMDEYRQVLKLLRRKRHFELVLSVTDTIIQEHASENVLKRAYAQALIDGGHLSAAIDVLKRLEADCIETGDEEELSETRGLLGRSYKQIFCNSAKVPACNPPGQPTESARRALLQAEKYYADEFRRDSRLVWHGINSVALQHRALMDGLQPGGTSVLERTSEAIARHFSETHGLTKPDDVAQAHDSPDHWACATLAENCMARDDPASALGWLAHYVEKPEQPGTGADAFEIASTLRQFTEVWRLDDTNEEHLRILEVLRAALLEREGGDVSVVNARAEAEAIDTLFANDDLEQILGKERFRNLAWYRTGLQRAQLVCKFVDQFGDGIGTGFAIRAVDIGIRHSAEWVVVTNAHVISDDATEQSGHPASLAPAAASVQFEASAYPDKLHAISRVLVSSSRQLLDFSVLALRDDIDFPDCCPYPVADKLPLLERDQRIYVIGHPRGSQLSFSLNDNLLLDYEAHQIHYRSPTEGGSSGSPLFNQAWELIGVHHAGSMTMKRLNDQPGNYPANEGLWVQSIRRAIAKNGRQISGELTEQADELQEPQ